MKIGFRTRFAALVLLPAVLLSAFLLVLQMMRYTYAKEADTKLNIQFSNSNKQAHIEAKTKLFQMSEPSQDGTISLVSVTGDELLAPGTEGEYIFCITNDSLTDVVYRAEFITSFSVKNSNLMLPLILSVVNEQKEETPLVLGEPYTDTHRMLQNHETYYTVRWKWPFESGDDERDTAIGNLAMDLDLEFSVQVNVTATEATDAPDETTSNPSLLPITSFAASNEGNPDNSTNAISQNTDSSSAMNSSADTVASSTGVIQPNHIESTPSTNQNDSSTSQSSTISTPQHTDTSDSTQGSYGNGSDRIGSNDSSTSAASANDTSAVSHSNPSIGVGSSSGQSDHFGSHPKNQATRTNQTGKTATGSDTYSVIGHAKTADNSKLTLWLQIGAFSFLLLLTITNLCHKEDDTHAYQTKQTKPKTQKRDSKKNSATTKKHNTPYKR